MGGGQTIQFRPWGPSSGHPVPSFGRKPCRKWDHARHFRTILGKLSPGPSKRSGSGAWHAPCSPAASLSQELPLFPPARAPGLAREHRTGQKRAFWEGKSIFSSKPRVQRPRSEASGTRARSSRPQHRKIGLSSQKQKGLCSRRKTAPGDTVAERALLANVRCVLLSFGCELRWVSKESKSPLQGASFGMESAVPVAQKFGKIRNPPSSEHLLGRNPKERSLLTRFLRSPEDRGQCVGGGATGAQLRCSKSFPVPGEFLDRSVVYTGEHRSSEEGGSAGRGRAHSACAMEGAAYPSTAPSSL